MSINIHYNITNCLHLKQTSIIIFYSLNMNG